MAPPADPPPGARPAAAEDAPRIAELATEMVEAMSVRRGAAEAAPAGWRGPLEPQVRRWLPGREGDRAAFVAPATGPVRAFALAHAEEWADGRRRGVLDACYVHPVARGAGLGLFLLDACIEWMTAEGCSGVDGAAFPGDRAAKNFYETAGFKARLLTMHRPLP